MSSNPVCFASNHIQHAVRPNLRKLVMQKCLEKLTPISDSFDSIAVCGASMMLVAPTIADTLGKSLVLVRKKGEKSHSDMEVEGVIPQKYIIIDDLICSGKTIKWVKKQIKDEHNRNSELVGIYLYIHDGNAEAMANREGWKLLSKKGNAKQ